MGRARIGTAVNKVAHAGPEVQAPIGDFGAGGPGIRGLSGVKGDSAQTSKGDKARQADQLKLF